MQTNENISIGTRMMNGKSMNMKDEDAKVVHQCETGLYEM